MSPTVISFYTAEWRYPEYAKKLQVDCERLGLPHYIVEMPSTGDYVKNCNIKPSFILSALKKFKSPVLWIDADGELLKAPELLLSIDCKRYDIAGNRSVNVPERVHVGSIWFNYTGAVLEFVSQWADSVVHKGIDDGEFNAAWQRYSNHLDFYELPAEYYFIHKNFRSPIPDDTVILHRLSSSDLKWQYKNNVEKK
jgi:hypothetical protein